MGCDCITLHVSFTFFIPYQFPANSKEISCRSIKITSANWQIIETLTNRKKIKYKDMDPIIMYSRSKMTVISSYLPGRVAQSAGP